MNIDTDKMNAGELQEMFRQAMNSNDYKERFKAEYRQLENRYQKLKRMLDKYKSGTLEFEPTCSYELLFEQLIYMGNYARILDERAKIEDIDLK